MPQFVDPEVSNFDEDCHQEPKQKREESKQEPEVKLDDKPIAEPDFILISSTEASPVKEAKGKATEASPVKEAKGKAKQAYVAIELSSTEASPIRSEVKLSEHMPDVLQQYLLITQGTDLGVALAALDKHGSLDAALEAFFGVAMHVGQDGSGNARELEQNVENFCKKPLEARPLRAICVRCRRRGARPRLQEEVAQGNARKDLPG